MKQKLSRYLVWRVLVLGAALFVFCAALLLAWGILLVRGGGSLWPVFVALAALVGLAYAAYRLWWLPYAQTEKMLVLFATGYTVQGLYDAPYMHSPGMEAAILKTRDFLNTDKLLSASKRQAQYLALQNQINPHFLYNTLEGIRGEALAAGLDSVADMTEALATFFRYTISKVENLVSVEDELRNTQTYFHIQQYRFGERLRLVIECDEADRENIDKCRLPKLTLQPIVENSILHGIEPKVGNGTLIIRLERTGKRLLIRVSDDGAGMDAATLARLNDNLSRSTLDYISPEKEKRGGIAVINVNNRIRLLFGEDYGIVAYSTPGVGTDVDITLPVITSDRQLEKGAAL